MTPTVLIVDDDQSMRDSLCNLMRSAHHEVRAFASAHEFLDSPRPEGPACLILDVNLGESSGLELQQALRGEGEAIPIIFITGFADVPTTVRALKAGAIEFLPKPFSDRELLGAVDNALRRSAAARERNAVLDSIRRRIESLTSRERQVLGELLAGGRNKQIAAKLGISEITVKIHRRRILQKMQAPSLVELALMMNRLEPIEVQAG
jgi:FixJ family two-component response regulator